MTEKNDGGPAFPVVEVHPVHGSRVDIGMSLRDWFAGQALQGKLAATSTRVNDYAVTYAEDCYVIADAMLKARTK